MLTHVRDRVGVWRSYDFVSVVFEPPELRLDCLRGSTVLRPIRGRGGQILDRHKPNDNMSNLLPTLPSQPNTYELEPQPTPPHTISGVYGASTLSPASLWTIDVWKSGQWPAPKREEDTMIMPATQETNTSSEADTATPPGPTRLSWSRFWTRSHFLRRWMTNSRGAAVR